MQRVHIALYPQGMILFRFIDGAAKFLRSTSFSSRCQYMVGQTGLQQFSKHCCHKWDCIAASILQPGSYIHSTSLTSCRALYLLLYWLESTRGEIEFHRQHAHACTNISAYIPIWTVFQTRKQKVIIVWKYRWSNTKLLHSQNTHKQFAKRFFSRDISTIFYFLSYILSKYQKIMLRLYSCG